MYPMVQMLQIPCHVNRNGLLHYRLIYDEVRSLFCVHALPSFKLEEHVELLIVHCGTMRFGSKHSLQSSHSETCVLSKPL
jgi:hypothetical protein